METGSGHDAYGIAIRPFTAPYADAVIDVLARAYVTNPLHIAAFDASRLDLNQAFFRIALKTFKGTITVATEGIRVVGVSHWVTSPACQPSELEKLRILPRVIASLGVGRSRRVLSWLSAWSRHDPAEPHGHLGPIAVEPAAQGRRIGGRLMREYCDALDRLALPGYLETDWPENVRFYERFGFEMTGAVPVLGVETWFMRRPRGEAERAVAAA